MIDTKKYIFTENIYNENL